MNETCTFCGAEYHRIEDHCCHCTRLLQQLAAMTKENERLQGVCHDYHTTQETMVGQLAAMTKERNSYYQTYRMNCDIETKALHEQLAASNAREAKLREVVLLLMPSENGWAKLGPHGVALAVSALALPSDDSALQERLRKEWERVANAAIEAWKCGKDIAAAIRALT